MTAKTIDVVLTVHQLQRARELALKLGSIAEETEVLRFRLDEDEDPMSLAVAAAFLAYNMACLYAVATEDGTLPPQPISVADVLAGPVIVALEDVLGN